MLPNKQFNEEFKKNMFNLFYLLLIWPTALCVWLEK